MASSVRAQTSASARPAIAAGRVLEVKETYSFKSGKQGATMSGARGSRVKLPAGKMLAPSVVSHAISLVVHPALSSTYPPLRGARRPREPLLARIAALDGRVHADLTWAQPCSLVKGARRAPTSHLASVEHAHGWHRIPVQLSRARARLRSMSHTACRHALGSARHGGGAGLRCLYGSADRWGTPCRVPVGSCR